MEAAQPVSAAARAVTVAPPAAGGPCPGYEYGAPDGATVYIRLMSRDGVRLARDALADIELVAQLRSAFAEAQSVMGQTLGEFGLTEQRYHLLLNIAAGGPEGTVQGSLARDLHCPESRISLLVHELSDAGLIDAVRDGSDRRHVRVRISSDGEATLDRAISIQRNALHRLIANLEVGEVTRLAELVARTYLGLDLSVSVREPSPRSTRPGRRGAGRSEPATEPRPTARVSPRPAQDAPTPATARAPAYRARRAPLQRAPHA
jgi:DNA-binding MarR family transcriptional regulator